MLGQTAGKICCLQIKKCCKLKRLTGFMVVLTPNEHLGCGMSAAQWLIPIGIKYITHFWDRTLSNGIHQGDISGPCPSFLFKNGVALKSNGWSSCYFMFGKHNSGRFIFSQTQIHCWSEIPDLVPIRIPINWLNIFTAHVPCPSQVFHVPSFIGPEQAMIL